VTVNYVINYNIIVKVAVIIIELSPLIIK